MSTCISIPLIYASSSNQNVAPVITKRQPPSFVSVVVSYFEQISVRGGAGFNYPRIILRLARFLWSNSN